MVNIVWNQVLICCLNVFVVNILQLVIFVLFYLYMIIVFEIGVVKVYYVDIFFFLVWENGLVIFFLQSLSRSFFVWRYRFYWSFLELKFWLEVVDQLFFICYNFCLRWLIFGLFRYYFLLRDFFCFLDGFCWFFEINSLIGIYVMDVICLSLG